MLRTITNYIWDTKPKAAVAKRKQKAKIKIAGRQLPPTLAKMPSVQPTPRSSHHAATTSRMFSLLTAASSLVSVAGQNIVRFTMNDETYLATSSLNLPQISAANAPCGLVRSDVMGEQNFLFKLCDDAISISGVNGASNSSLDLRCLIEYLNQWCLDVKTSENIAFGVKTAGLICVVGLIVVIAYHARQDNQEENQNAEEKEQAPIATVETNPVADEYNELINRIDKIRELIKTNQIESKEMNSLLKANDIYFELINNELSDPITSLIFHQPVTVSSGKTYEKQDIPKYKGKCPLTTLQLTGTGSLNVEIPVKIKSVLKNSNKNISQLETLLNNMILSPSRLRQRR